MRNSTFLINCTNPFDYLNSLQEIGNKKLKLWNGYEIASNSSQVKANCQIFIKNDLHFYRTDYVVGYNILLKIKKEKEDQEYIDFRINSAGSTTSMIEDKKLQLCPGPKKEQSFHIFIKKEVLGLDPKVLEVKRKTAQQCLKLGRITADVLSIPASGNRNALRIEGKMLELSYAYLEHLHSPIASAPAFLSNDYKVHCLSDARKILEATFTSPPTIKDLSKKVGINSNQLKTGFKYLFGSTIRQFVIGLRLDQARQLVLNTKLPLGVICNQVGYTNHGHFSKLYKERFGLSPLYERGVDR